MNYLTLVVHHSRRISRDTCSSSRCTCLVPIFILEMHGQMNYRCLSKLVQTDKVSLVKKQRGWFILPPSSSSKKMAICIGSTQVESWAQAQNSRTSLCYMHLIWIPWRINHYLITRDLAFTFWWLQDTVSVFYLICFAKPEWPQNRRVSSANLG